jgi:hypothetical protein
VTHLVDTELGWIDRRTTMNRTCRGCGCTDMRACPGGCGWVLLDIDQPAGICNQCAEACGWDPVAMATAGFNDGFPESYFTPEALLPAELR